MNRFKRTLAALLTICLMVTLMPTTAFAAVDIGKPGDLVVDPLKEKLNGNTVYFGVDGYNGNAPILWRIVAKDSNTITLFCDDFVHTESGTTRQYDPTEHNRWSGSDICAWLNGTGSYTSSGFLPKAFNPVEQNAIATYGTNETGNPQTIDINQKIVLPSVAEMDGGGGYATGLWGFNWTDRTISSSSWWWLRSPSPNPPYVAFVDVNGRVGSDGGAVSDERGSVRPAFNLNLSSVLFTSASGASKSDFDLVGKDKVDNTRKLTLKNGKNDFAATLPDSGYAGKDIAVTVSNMGTGTYSQTSAMLTDDSGTVVAYGNIGDNSAGEKKVPIPADIPAGDYTLRVFAEQVNGDKLTNYASEVVERKIKIKMIPSVTITKANHMTITSDSGEETQTDLTGAMMDVVYTADTGYYFPDNYVSTITGLTGGELSGVRVTRNDATKITVSGSPTGIPTANVMIALMAPTEKAEQGKPTGLSDGVDKIAGTKATMQYAARADAPANEWKDCTDGNTTVAAGTWYVRYKETDTKKAGAAAEVTVSKAASRYDVTITWGDHMTKTSDSGEVKQTGLTGAMKAVVYTAEAGFYFPTDYSVAPVNGISVKRDNYTQITVAGTPTANATIHLIKPTEKDQQDAPTGLSDGVEKIAGTKTTMQYAVSADATADAWKACTDGNTTVKAGTWYVRYKETETKKAGATAAVTVTAPKTPTPKPTYTITDGAGTAYTIGSGKTLTITCSGALSDLTGIYVDEKQVDAKHYTVKSGSTILTFKTSYLDSLSAGTHNLTFAYGKETVKTTFEIKAAAAKATTPTVETPAKKDVSPKTGDQTSTLWLLLLVLASGVGVCYMRKRTVGK